MGWIARFMVRSRAQLESIVLRTTPRGSFKFLKILSQVCRSVQLPACSRHFGWTPQELGEGMEQVTEVVGADGKRVEKVVKMGMKRAVPENIE
jgi:hypothetical protein